MSTSLELTSAVVDVQVVKGEAAITAPSRPASASASASDSTPAPISPYKRRVPFPLPPLPALTDDCIRISAFPSQDSWTSILNNDDDEDVVEEIIFDEPLETEQEELAANLLDSQKFSGNTDADGNCPPIVLMYHDPDQNWVEVKYTTLEDGRVAFQNVADDNKTCALLNEWDVVDECAWDRTWKRKLHAEIRKRKQQLREDSNIPTKKTKV
eukprot:NODE_847_length_1286_cov_269.280517_g645_i0.p1 GENE.NODE_847_length_1286_cov_269.280517_g645_i0~~NODE_847_length_1286_cov_269.280517_g645_i0.p1  ORF type:complete len:212 (-),score=54.50 NODE_847_length_1286_cov_269.280517_g645_i0:588-1223(-)